MVPIDGLWIDMNEPASFCNGHCPNGIEGPEDQENDEDIQQIRMGYTDKTSNLDGFDPRNPAYRINNAGWEAPLMTQTVAPDALHYNNTIHYHVHNLYGKTARMMS